MIKRRGLFGLVAAPAIVRVSNLMPISMLTTLPPDYWRATTAGIQPGLDIEAFRVLILPGLREAFRAAYGMTNDHNPG